MREISPALNVSVDDYIKMLPAEAKRIVEEIRCQKREGTRRRPSLTLIDRSAVMTQPMRGKLIETTRL